MTWNVGTVVIPASCWSKQIKEGGGRERTKKKKKKEGGEMTWNEGTVVIPASCWSITAGGASLAYLVIGIILRHWYHIKALVSC